MEAKKAIEGIITEVLMHEIDDLNDLKHDFLTLVFQEYLASKSYLELTPEAKKQKFQQYKSLDYILGEVVEFKENYPPETDFSTEFKKVA